MTEPKTDAPVPISPEVRRLLDAAFDEADRYASTFNLAQLGGYVLDHPEVIGRCETVRQKAAREHRERTKR